ncbi:MAG: transcription termination factor NusA [Chlamydiota bacterium]
MNKDLIAIFEYLEREKGIKRDVVIQAIEDSLLAAAKKSVQGVGKVQVQIEPKSGDIEVVTQKKIVQEVEDPEEEISLEEALELEPSSELDQWLEMVVTPQDFGRIAAQTARQVITQKLRGAEKNVIYEEYRHRVGEIISGKIKRFFRGRNVIVDLGKVEAVLPERHYPRTERFNVGEKLQALLLEVRDTENGGAEVGLSRSDPQFVKELFKLEVPEIADSIVSVENIVREPGYRTKMVVRSHDLKVDPVGTCVGVRGTRIKNVIREINNEKIDIIPFSDDSIQLLQNAIAPIEISKLKESEENISIVVSDEDYPIVIGKKGMNARLIAKLIGTELEVQKMSEYQKRVTLEMEHLAKEEDEKLDAPLKLEGISSLIIESLIGAGFDTLRKVVSSSPHELTSQVPGFNYFDIAEKILEQTRNKKV